MVEEPTGSGVTAQQGVVAPTDSPQGQPVQPDSGVTADDQQQPQEPQGDDYWKNKAFESERKYNNVAKELSEIRETIKNQGEALAKPPEAQYSEEQLQAALSSETLTPEQASFARTELKKLQDKKLEERDKRLLEQFDKRTRDQMMRQQAEQQVVNDPRFAEAFIKLPNGQVQWKQDSQLAQMIGSYMQDPRLSEQPDAIAIAAKLAYADHVSGQQTQQLTQVTRENEQLKGQTMIEGGGRVYNKQQPDGFREAMDRLKSGDRRAGPSAIKEFMKRRDAVR